MVTAERSAVFEACSRLLEEWLAVMAVHWPDSILPTKDEHYFFFESDGSGGYGGKDAIYSSTDWPTLWDVVREGATPDAEEVAVSLLEKYIAKRGIISSMGGHLHDVRGSLLVPLLPEYWRASKGSLRRRRLMKDVTLRMLATLDAPYYEIDGLIVLEGFSAANSFRLGKGTLIRPIEEDELAMLGETDSPLIGSPMSKQVSFGFVPRRDWWVCSHTAQSPRGTADAWNSVYQTLEDLQLAFRAFKHGALRTGFGFSRDAGRHGMGARMRGTRLEPISPSGSEYRLSATEIGAFQRFWKALIPILRSEHHYLHVPVRRLRVAGTRSEMQDAIVDYVVGLEALLGKANERTELGYRFRVRGSVLLAASPSTRRTQMKVLEGLYDMRSRIVHGQQVEGADLDRAMPLAEDALRRVWRWYFRNFRAQTDNSKGIDGIDALLVGHV